MPKQSNETIRIPVHLPMKGVNQNFSRSAQPEATCFDALNVLPIDRQGRLRIALRGGAAQTSLLSAASKVRLVHVASTVGGGSSVFDEDWMYTAGNLATVSGGRWIVESESNASASVSGTGTESVTFTAGATRAAHYYGRVEFIASGTYTLTMPISLKSTVNGTDDAYIQVRLRRPKESGESLSDNFFGGWGITITHQGGSGWGNQIRVDFYTQDRDGNNTFPGPYIITSQSDANGVWTVDITGTSFEIKRDGVSVATGTSVDLSPPIGNFLDLRHRATVASTGTPIAGFTAAMTITAPSSTNSILQLVATSGTNTYTGTSPTIVPVVSNSGTYPIDSDSTFVSAATLFLKTYIVDGTSIRKLDLTTSLFEAYAASAGSAPTGCTLAVAWRGRLILSGNASDPQNVYASKVGDPTNWDYAVDPPTETMAWAANAANLGRIGEPVLALVPLSDDIMLIGCEQSIWAIRGDIAADGSIDNVSEGAGIISQSAWCRAADGSLYFVGPNGLYKAAPDGTGPIEISRDVFRQFFRSINRGSQHVSLVFDKERYGIWIFVAEEAQEDGPVNSLFYDLRLEGYWPVEFTNMVVAGPIHAAYWDGYDSDTRYPLLGGYDGGLYSINFSDRYDNDGTTNHAIPGYVVMGPVSLSNVDDAVLTKMDITSGELGTGDTGVFEMKWTVRGGPSAYDVTDGTPPITATGTFTAGARAQTQYPRVRGGWFTLKFENGPTSGDYFSIENVVTHVLPAGNQRV